MRVPTSITWDLVMLLALCTQIIQPFSISVTVEGCGVFSGAVQLFALYAMPIAGYGDSYSFLSILPYRLIELTRRSAEVLQKGDCNDLKSLPRERDCARSSPTCSLHAVS